MTSHANAQAVSNETIKELIIRQSIASYSGKEDGPWVQYWETGQLQSKGTYKDGKEDGLWVYYHDNGQLYYKGTYKDGEKVGPWVGYNKDGTVWDEGTGTYKNGVKVK